MKENQICLLESLARCGFCYHTCTQQGSKKPNQECEDILAKSSPKRKKGTNLNLNPPQVSVPRTFCIQHSASALQTGKNQRKRTCRGHGGGKDHVEPSVSSSRAAVAAGSVGGCDAIGRKHVTLFSHSRADLLRLFRLSRLLFLHPHRHTQTWSGTQSHPSFSIFPLIQVRPGQLSLSHRLQPVLMSPLFYFFSWLRVMQTDGSSIMTTNHFCIFKKKGHFSFPQIAEQKFSKWSTYCVIFQRGFK